MLSFADIITYNHGRDYSSKRLETNCRGGAALLESDEANHRVTSPPCISYCDTLVLMLLVLSLTRVVSSSSLCRRVSLLLLLVPALVARHAC